MAFKAKLSIAGKEYNVLEASYELNQETNESGAPSSVVRGGKIHATVEATGDSFLFEWMTNSFERKNAVLTFVRPDTDGKLKEVKFDTSYLTSYREEFDHKGGNPLTETFTISARTVSSGGGELTNEWPN